MATDADTLRAEMLERWERSAAGWGRRQQIVREEGMPVSERMIELLSPEPGQRLLELAAGPGETGFLAAELVQPGGTLICSDAAEQMLSVARARADELGLSNVEFRRLELEWIDLEAASVDGVLCRWGVMLVLDPAAALREMRRVLRPGGRLALAVWDGPEHNPWATSPMRALIELGHATPPDPDAPGMFRLADQSVLERMLADAGFTGVMIEGVDLVWDDESVEQYVAVQLDLSAAFSAARSQLPEQEWGRVVERIAELTRPYVQEDGSLRLPGRSLVAGAEA